MKSEYEIWASSKGELSFCAETFEDARRARAVKPLRSSFAHPYAPSVPSRRLAKAGQMPQKAQFAIFGARVEREARAAKLGGPGKVTWS